MRRDLARGDRTALVTGASSGIGEATAIRLLADGFRVYGAARRVDRMAGLEEAGATALAMDVTSEEQVEEAVGRIGEEAGGVDVLVNNAGFGLYGPMESVPIDEARYQFEVNVFGLARLTQMVIPGMRVKGRGRIVNVSSMGGKVYFPLGSWYHASKHALEGWSDCLRLEVAPFGIDVIVIEPGAIETEFGDVLAERLQRLGGEGPYAELTEKYMELGRRHADTGGVGAPPSLIGNLIGDAVAAESPRTRYAAGPYAKPMMAVRKWLGDRAYDRLVMRMF